jgi:hypothetical protein
LPYLIFDTSKFSFIPVPMAVIKLIISSELRAFVGLDFEYYP